MNSTINDIKNCILQQYNKYYIVYYQNDDETSYTHETKIFLIKENAQKYYDLRCAYNELYHICLLFMYSKIKDDDIIDFINKHDLTKYIDIDRKVIDDIYYEYNIDFVNKNVYLIREFFRTHIKDKIYYYELGHRIRYYDCWNMEEKTFDD